MTPEQRKMSRDFKRMMRDPKAREMLKKAIPLPAAEPCPYCHSGELREMRKGNAVIIACTQIINHRIVVGCGYSELVFGGEI